MFCTALRLARPVASLARLFGTRIARFELRIALAIGLRFARLLAVFMAGAGATFTAGVRVLCWHGTIIPRVRLSCGPE